MNVDGRSFRGHLLVLLAIVSGIAGMGMVFDATMHGSLVGVTRGIPFLLIGLWWAGRALGRSMIESRHRRPAQDRAITAHPPPPSRRAH